MLRSRNWVDSFLMAYFWGTCGVGFVGLIGYPSPGIQNAIGYDVTLYSFLMAVAGVIGLIGWAIRGTRTEVVALVSISLLTLLHAALVLAGADPWTDGLQTSIRLAIAPFTMLGFAYYRHSTVLTRKDLRDAHQEVRNNA